MDSMILTLLIFLPVFGAVAMLPAAKIVGKDNPNIFKWIALVITGLQLLLAVVLYMGFDSTLSVSTSPYTVQLDWIKHFNIQYFVGVDGLSMPMVLLTALLSFLSILSLIHI